MKKTILFIIGLIIITLGLDFFYKPGVYFGLDVTFFPIYELKGFFEQSFYRHFIDLLNFFLGYEFYGRFILLSTLIVGSILGVYISNLVTKILDLKEEKYIFLLKIISIVFVMFNPFAYERFITQTGIILAVYLIGLGLVFLIQYLLEKNVDNYINSKGLNDSIKNSINSKGLKPSVDRKNKYLYLASLFLGLSLNIMPHSIVFMFIIFIITLSFFYKYFSIKNIILSIFIVFILNFNWIIGSLFLNNDKTISSTVSTFNTQNIESFTSNSLNGLGTEITNLLLYGFWAEKYNNRILRPENDYWYLTGFIILGIVIFGGIKLHKRKRKLTLYLLTLAIVSYILSLGISSSLFSWFNELLYTYVPYYIGMREPQKLTGLVMIVYALFFLVGVYSILENNNNFKRKEYIKKILLNQYSIISYIFILIIIWSPNVLFGYNGQLKISDYPREIFQSRDNLMESNDTNVLVLPWHSYIACEWTNGKVFSNPIGHILKPVETIMADNIEIAGLYTNSNNDRSKQIDEFIKTKDFEILKNLDIDTIYFMDRCADFPDYKYLEKSDELKKIFESIYIKIYKIK